MPLIRVSDQVHEHIKRLSHELQVPVDAALRQALNIDGAQSNRTYTSRDELMPLEMYRWLILSAWPTFKSSEGHVPAMTRSMLQVYLGKKATEELNLSDAYPHDFNFTPNNKAPRMRWKVRFTNLTKQMIEDGVLTTEGTRELLSGVPHYRMVDSVQNNFLRLGLHLDTINGNWWFTKLSEAVNMDNWLEHHPLTINDERNTPISAWDDDYMEWLDRAHFIWGRQKYENLKDTAQINLPAQWATPSGGMVATITNSGIITDRPK